MRFSETGNRLPTQFGCRGSIGRIPDDFIPNSTMVSHPCATVIMCPVDISTQSGVPIVRTVDVHPGDEVIVVLGCEADAVRDRIKHSGPWPFIVRTVDNTDWARGNGTSLYSAKDWVEGDHLETRIYDEVLLLVDPDPSEITDVVFTHGHPDHLWGLIDDFDEEVFVNAAYHMNQAEWDYWTDPGTVDSIGEERKTFAVGAASRLKRIEEKINLFNGAGDVVAGIEAVPTYGHTPGHTSFVIHQGSNATMVTGDAVTHAEISFRHPEWISGADQDSDMAIKTRKMVLDRLAADDMTIIGFHLSKPGEGRVETEGDAYRFVAE